MITVEYYIKERLVKFVIKGSLKMRLCINYHISLVLNFTNYLNEIVLAENLSVVLVPLKPLSGSIMSAD